MYSDEEVSSFDALFNGNIRSTLRTDTLVSMVELQNADNFSRLENGNLSLYELTTPTTGTAVVQLENTSGVGEITIGSTTSDNVIIGANGTSTNEGRILIQNSTNTSTAILSSNDGGFLALYDSGGQNLAYIGENGTTATGAMGGYNSSGDQEAFMAGNRSEGGRVGQEGCGGG